MAKVHVISGKATDTERNYTYRKSDGYKPYSKGGDLYGRGKNTTYSLCSKSFADKGKPTPPTVKAVHAESYTMSTEIVYKHVQPIEEKRATTVKVSKIVKARYIKGARQN